MDKTSDKKQLAEDIGLSVVAIAIWAVVCYGIVWLFPGASWIWYLFGIYAAFTLLEGIFDFSFKKIIRRLLEPTKQGRK